MKFSTRVPLAMVFLSGITSLVRVYEARVIKVQEWSK